jgi:phosphate transport system substrate-binding protein
VNVSLVMRVAGVSAIAALGLAACGSNNSSGGSTNAGSGTDSSSNSGGAVTLTPQGSTFQQTLQQQWASKYTNAKVTYSGTGSTAGIQQFTTGKIPFAGSDVTMTSDEQTAANKACGSTALTIPITSGGVALIYNLPGVSNLKLDAPTIAGIFNGSIKKWNDPKIAALNGGAKLPSTAITTFFRADGSGTTNVLTSFMNTLDPKDWTNPPDKVWPSGLPGQGATGSAGVVQGVKNTAGGITYAEITFAKQNNLPTASVKGAKGGFTAISASTVAKAINTGFSVTGSGNDLAGALSFKQMAGYPISTVSYVLVCSKYSNSATGAAVKGYLTYAAGTGQSQASSLGFAPLPSALDSKAQAAIATIS